MEKDKNQLINRLEEELFCTRFELNALSDLIIRDKAERWVPDFIHTVNENEHQARYIYASKYVKDKKVLDIACGTGKGSFILMTKGEPSEITAGDIDSDAIRYAKHRFYHERINFQNIDAEKIDYIDQFDVITSFETIEHLKKIDVFLEKVKKALKNKGVFIVSTPISSKEIDYQSKNPYHVQEWGFKAFHKIISKHFNIEDIYIQSYELYRPENTNKIIKLLKKIRNKIISLTGLERRTNKREDKIQYYELEKFSGQYDEKELGVSRIGYQIIIAKKND